MERELLQLVESGSRWFWNNNHRPFKGTIINGSTKSFLHFCKEKTWLIGQSPKVSRQSMRLKLWHFKTDTFSELNSDWIFFFSVLTLLWRVAEDMVRRLKRFIVKSTRGKRSITEWRAEDLKNNKRHLCNVKKLNSKKNCDALSPTTEERCY